MGLVGSAKSSKLDYSGDCQSTLTCLRHSFWYQAWEDSNYTTKKDIKIWNQPKIIKETKGEWVKLVTCSCFPKKKTVNIRGNKAIINIFDFLFVKTNSILWPKFYIANNL